MTVASTNHEGGQRCVDDELGEIAGQLNVLNARLVAVAERVVESEEWREHGLRSAAQFLAWRLGLSPERARQIERVARRRRSFPTIIGAFDRGELSVEQVAEVVKAPEWAESLLLDVASISTVSKLRRAMRSRNFDGPPAVGDTDAAPSDQADAAPPTDRVTLGLTRDGRWRINGDFGLDTGRRIEAALTERKDALFTAGDDTASWADALVDCCARSLDTVESASRRDHYRTWIHLDVASSDATTTDGWRLPEHIRDHLLCDGVAQPVWERDGVPFSVGRGQRIVPDRTRRIIERRDRGCRVPGCTADRFVEVHHIVHWLDGGRTDTSNLISLCPYHHKLHHRGELGITGNADQYDAVRFTNRDGAPIGGAGPPTVPTGQPPGPGTAYRSPLRERFDWNWIGLGWIHPDELRRRREQSRQCQRSADDESDHQAA